MVGMPKMHGCRHGRWYIENVGNIFSIQFSVDNRALGARLVRAESSSTSHLPPYCFSSTLLLTLQITLQLFQFRSNDYLAIGLVRIGIVIVLVIIFGAIKSSQWFNRGDNLGSVFTLLV